MSPLAPRAAPRGPNPAPPAVRLAASLSPSSGRKMGRNVRFFAPSTGARTIVECVNPGLLRYG